MKRSQFAALAAISLFGVAGSVARADYDVAPSVSSGQIVTNAFDDGTDDFVSNVRVFNYGFDDPYDTEDPGFHPQIGSGFAGAAALHIAAATSLSYWDGTGLPAFSTLPNSETVTLAFGLGNSITIGATAPGGSVNLGTTDSNGSFDRHLESTLTGQGGSDPALGLYLVGLQLTSDGLTSSQPFYVIYNTGDDDALSDAAALYVRNAFAPGSNLVPEPAILGLSAIPFLILAGRRKARCC